MIEKESADRMDDNQVDGAANCKHNHFQHADHHLVDAASDQNENQRISQVLHIKKRARKKNIKYVDLLCIREHKADSSKID